jgi:isoleucyl-tRNA synthetase
MSAASAPSEFPLEADPARVEPRMLAWWAERGIWARMLEKNAGAEPFVLPDGPSVGSGPLQAGHVLNKVLQDMVVKYRSLSGRRCDFIALRDSHESSIFERLGVFGSWEAPLYGVTRPVPWCVNEQTALTEAEVEFAPRTSPSVYVAFRAGPELAERFSSLQGREVFFVTWTAAPWTLPANAAIAVNADAEYVFYEAGSRVLCVAKELLAKVLAEVKADELVMKNARLPGGDVETVAFDDLRKVLVYASGEDLEHLTYQHPFLERTGRVVLGAHVTLEAGTGLVHTAPAHGLEDHELGLKYGLEGYSPVRGDGRYDETVGPALRGLRVLEAEPVILGLLAESGALLNAKTDTVEQSHPSCGRCHHPVISLAVAQGFIALDKPLAGEKTLRRRVLEEVDRVKWVPDEAHSRIRETLEGLPDWCISRQKSGGVPLPIASCEGCGEAVVSPELMERVAAAIEREGAGVWERTPVQDFLGTGFRCASCGRSAFQREKDTLDAGFGSACRFLAMLESQQRLPADLLLEGREQLLGWVTSAMLVCVGTRDVAPYRSCFVHGLVVDEQGEEMSQRRENATALEEIIQRYGAELLRLWAAASDCPSDVRISDKILQELSQGYAKIRGTLHAVLGSLHGFNPARDRVSAAELLPEDSGVRERLAEVVVGVFQAYEACEFHLVYAAVLDFCAKDLSAVYFGSLKDRLSTTGTAERSRRSAQTVLFEVASALLPLLAPVLSFTAEEAWQQLPGRPAESVFLASLPPS